MPIEDAAPAAGTDPVAVLVDALQAATAAQGVALQKASNLADLPAPATARTNLGLGTAATASSAAFDAAGAATAVQATSLQKTSNLSDLAVPATARTNLGLGSAATMTPAQLAADSALSGTYGVGLSVGLASGTDDTAAINAAITSAATFAVGRVFGKPGEAYQISAPIVVRGGTELDMTGCTITLKSGSNCNMVKNAALVAGTGSDTGITVTGGTWARGSVQGAGNNLHSLYFQNVTGLNVRDLTYTSSSGKYGVYVYACSNFRVTNITFACSSDGVHMTGACTNGLVSGIYGTTGDDSVAITTVDYANYLNGNLGDATDIVIEQVRTTNTGPGGTVKILAGTSGAATAARRITVRDISGTSPSSALYIGGDTAEAGTQGGIHDTITAERVSNAGTGHNVIVATGTHRALTLRATPSPSGTSKHACYISSGAVIEDITFEGSYFTPPASTYAILMQGASAYPSVATMRVINCRLNVATTSAGLIQTSHASCVLGAVFVKDLMVDRAAWAIGDFYMNPVALYLNGVRCTAGQVSGWFVVETAGVVDVKAAHGLTGPSGFGANGAGQVASRSFGLPVNVNTSTALQKNVGDQAYNNNAGNLPIGPVVADGTRWRSVATGAVKSGTAVLVGGTVTVADTAITANSVIRLSHQTIGGTPGAVYVSAKAVGASFTVTSTSASDTSTVAYDVLAY